MSKTLEDEGRDQLLGGGPGQKHFFLDFPYIPEMQDHILF